MTQRDTRPITIRFPGGSLHQTRIAIRSAHRGGFCVEIVYVVNFPWVGVAEFLFFFHLLDVGFRVVAFADPVLFVFSLIFVKFD